MNKMVSLNIKIRARMSNLMNNATKFVPSIQCKYLNDTKLLHSVPLFTFTFLYVVIYLLCVEERCLQGIKSIYIFTVEVTKMIQIVPFY